MSSSGGSGSDGEEAEAIQKLPLPHPWINRSTLVCRYLFVKGTYVAWAFCNLTSRSAAVRHWTKFVIAGVVETEANPCGELAAGERWEEVWSRGGEPRLADALLRQDIERYEQFKRSLCTSVDCQALKFYCTYKNQNDSFRAFKKSSWGLGLVASSSLISPKEAIYTG